MSPDEQSFWFSTCLKLTSAPSQAPLAWWTGRSGSAFSARPSTPSDGGRSAQATLLYDRGTQGRDAYHVRLVAPSVNLAVAEHVLNLLSQQVGRRQGRVARVRIETRACPQAPSRRSLISASHSQIARPLFLHIRSLSLCTVSHMHFSRTLCNFSLSSDARTQRGTSASAVQRSQLELIITTKTRCAYGSANVTLAELPVSRAFAPADHAPWQRRYRRGDSAQGPIGPVRRGRQHGGGTTRRANCVGTWCRASTTPSCC